MKNCVTVFFFLTIITLPAPGVKPMSNLISKFLRSIDILDPESIPIIYYTNSSHQTSEVTEIPFFISATNNLNQAYCDKGLRNQTGILLATVSNVSDAMHFLSQLNRIQPSCDFMGFYPKVFVILDSTCLSNEPIALSTFTISEASSVEDWNFPVDSDVYIAIPFENCQNNDMRLLEIYRIMNHSVVEEVAASSDYLQFTLEGLSSRNRRLNFYGQTIRSIIYEDKASPPRFKSSMSIFREGMEDMALILNFTFTYVFGDSWIHFDKNGDPQGIAKLLQNSDGDILGQSHELSLERQANFEFIYPNFHFRESIFFRQPTTLYPNLIFQPYNLGAWIAFTFSFFGLSICIHCVISFKDKPMPSLKKPKIVFKVLGLFCQQGWLENPSTALEYTLSLKMTIVAGFVLSTFFYNLYAASIISIISLRQPPIKTVEQLLQNGAKLFVDVDDRSSYRYLDKLTDPEKLEAIKTTEVGITTVSQNLPASVAFITFRHYLMQTVAVREKITFEIFCKTISQLGLEVKGLPVYNGMYVKKHSPLRKIFLYSQIRRAEVGCVHHHRVNYARATSPACFQSRQDVESLDMGVVSPAFVVSFSFVLCSFFILILEIVLGYPKSHSRNILN